MPDPKEKRADGKPTRTPEKTRMGFMELPKSRLPEWTVLQIVAALKKGRNVVAVFADNPTAKVKYGRRLQQAALDELGEPLNTLGSGFWPNTIQWRNKVVLALALESPEDTFQSTPPMTDVVRVAIPKDWKKR